MAPVLGTDTNANRLVHGLWVVLATPFDDAGALDHASLAREVEWAQAAGADGVVALGVFGEAANLSLEEQRAAAETVAGVAGDTPVIFGVSGRSATVCVEQASNALQGALAGGATTASTAVMIQVNAPSPTTVARHLTAVHEATGAPVVLQDYPTATGVRVNSAQILEIVESSLCVVAIKAEAPPTPVAIAELREHTHIPVFGGLGGVGLVDELSMGAAGAMTGFSAPEGLRATIDGYHAGGFETAREAWAPWLPLANFEGQAGIALAIRKMLLHRRGVLDHPTVRPPSFSMPDGLLPLLEQHLASAPWVTNGSAAAHRAGSQ